MHNRKIAIIGLGYVGLPVAASFAKNGNSVIAFDINTARITELQQQYDRTGEVDSEALTSNNLVFTSQAPDLASADFHIVTVPTPITENHQPDLTPLISASRTIGKYLKKGDIVVYESTVYPGGTEEVCVPILETESGLIFGSDFSVGYSPERINPGDKEHRFENILKVVSGSDKNTLKTVADVYSSVVKAGIHQANSIKVAEAAKVIENTQRDVNIALMNELALIFDRLNIRTKDVLDAAGTKWNFLRFSPGLVGGHCIGVDPYYLTSKADAVGYHPEVILSGRRINDTMGQFIAQKLIKMLSLNQLHLPKTKVGILGLTFKEDVPDLRNSRVPDIINELREFGISPMIHDAMADKQEALEEYHIDLSDLTQMTQLDAVIIAVPHRQYLDQIYALLDNITTENAVIIDIKSCLIPENLPASMTYWSL